MRRLLIVVVLLTGAVLAGCTEAPQQPQPTDGGWPALPATVSAEESAPEIPANGALGRGALPEPPGPGEPGPGGWPAGSAELILDRGSSLLIRVREDDGEPIVALNPVSGEQSVAITPPDGWSVVLPGEPPRFLYAGGRPV